MLNGDALSKRSNGKALPGRPNGHNLQYKSQDAATGNDKRGGNAASWSGLLAAATHATLPTWVTMVLMVSMIFGGCCSNVRATGLGPRVCPSLTQA